MEAMLLASSPDQSIYPYKPIRNPKKSIHTSISRPYENLGHSNLHLNIHGGLLSGTPPSLITSSLPSSVLLFNPRQKQQPPLLPLPIPRPYSSLPSRNRGLSSHPTKQKINRSKDQDLRPKKPKSSTSPKKQDAAISTTKGCLMIASTNRMGPDPSDLPKEVSRVLKPVVSSSTAMEDMEKESGSIFSLSPPPSSLPLPKFSLRPKLSCNAETSGIDAGATNDLRRLLRIR